MESTIAKSLFPAALSVPAVVPSSDVVLPHPDKNKLKLLKNKHAATIKAAGRKHFLTNLYLFI
jgi:hypothetical protein